ncbi:peptide chain release factor 1, mitochondrial-like [Arachis hypogaea]|uniref:peptide chain release factor 1, mitochondrial-like n=1 Tax=Arachis hypogaea TaxID=3818 RepID=UPI000DEC9ED4
MSLVKNGKFYYAKRGFLSQGVEPEISPSEYARANKELSGSLHLITHLRAKQKEIDGLKSLVVECSGDKDMINMATEERAGSSGEEASLFAMDIFKMYEKYAHKNGWKFEVVDIAQSDLKGYKVDVQLKNEDLKIDTYRSSG